MDITLFCLQPYVVKSVKGLQKSRQRKIKQMCEGFADSKHCDVRGYMYFAYPQWTLMRHHLHPHLDLGHSRARGSHLDPDVDTRSRPSLVQRETSPRPSSSCLVGFPVISCS